MAQQQSEQNVCGFAEVDEEIAELVKQRNALQKKIRGLQLSYSLIYCECRKCSESGRVRNLNCASSCRSTADSIDETALVSVGIQVDRTSLEDLDQWTDTSEWNCPDDEGEPTRNESAETSNFEGDASRQSMGSHEDVSSSQGYWQQFTPRIEHSKLSKSPGSTKSCDSLPDSNADSQTDSTKTASSFQETIARKLDHLCVAICKRYSCDNPSLEVPSMDHGADNASTETGNESRRERSRCAAQLTTGSSPAAPFFLFETAGLLGSVSLEYEMDHDDADSADSGWLPGGRVVVTDIHPGGLADRCGLIRRGDTLVAIDGIELEGFDDQISLVSQIAAQSAASASTLGGGSGSSSSGNMLTTLTFRRGEQLYTINGPRRFGGGGRLWAESDLCEAAAGLRERGRCLGGGGEGSDGDGGEGLPQHLACPSGAVVPELRAFCF